MKALPIVAVVAVIIGASFLALNSETLNLQKEVSPPKYDKDISKRYAAYAKIAYCP